MAEDLIPILTRFHREVVLPDIERIVGDTVGTLEGRMNAHFDAIYERFDRLDTESLRAPGCSGPRTLPRSARRARA